MFGRGPAKAMRSAAVVAALSACAAAGASSAATPAAESASWVQKEVNFRYVGFTTKYSCDGLRDRMRGILLQLGARDDLKISGYGCTGVPAPETTPGVRVVMHVLQPAGATPGQTTAAHWKTVDLLADRDLLDAARDCELISQLDRDVLPQFAVRHVDYRATCSVGTPLVGGTRLKADVLVADGASPAAASR
ncbi:MAG TPA: hypothetical protein VM713_03650 [Steroidobacteraceae bacterium]|nr:hypothetical protein [Steroidobacteraceae bacterium]